MKALAYRFGGETYCCVCAEQQDLYLLHKHTSETITIKTNLYYVDGVQVCLSWYGNDEHPREMCDFCLWRKFGTQPVCGITFNDICHNPRHPKLCATPEDCPLKMKRVFKGEENGYTDKILVLEHCFECKHFLEDGDTCHEHKLYCDAIGRCIDVDLRKVHFPEWCPLESVKKGE